MREREPVHVVTPAPSPPHREWRNLLVAEAPPLREFARNVYGERWLVGSVAVFVLALAVAYLAVATPIFASSMLIQVEDTRRTVAGLEDISAIFSDKSPAETEIAILRSHLVLEPVVDQLGLDLSTVPERSRLETLRERLTGRPGSGPSVRVAQLSVAEELEGEPMRLTVEAGGRWVLALRDGTRLLQGDTGTLATRTAEPHVELLVSRIDAPPGSHFAVVKRVKGEVIDDLRASLRIVENGKGSGIISISVEGPDPKHIARLLGAVGSTYLRHNVERKSAEAEKTLAFLDAQLPDLKAKVERSEAALKAFQSRKGTVSLSRETETMLDRSVDVEKELSNLELQRTDLRQKYTENHPALQSLSQKIDQLRSRRSSMDARLKDLPATELESARIMRDVKVAQQLYDLLLNKAQELRILRSGIVGNVRIIDPAVAPRRPARPVRSQVLALGLLLGLGCGIAAGLMRRAFDEGADDPVQIEARVGLPVYVTVPHSDNEERLHSSRRARKGAPWSLAVVAPEDVAIESLRSLRTALQFALVEARSNVLCITSPSPAAGKSFVSLNLAVLLAAAGKRVLLLDADLRRGRLHRAFALPRAPGISDFVSGASGLDAVIRPSGVDRLDVVATGRIPPNPAELLGSHPFQQLLATAAPRYDLVVVDTPPVLAVTDASLVARRAGVNLLVLRAGCHSLREISLAVQQFTQSGLTIHGAILNDARFSRGGVGRYGRYYEYRSQPD